MKIYIRATSFFIVILVFCFSMTSVSCAEGNAKRKHYIEISMDIREKPLRAVLEDISERTGYHVEVSDDLLDIPISGNFKNVTLTALLERILKGRNVFILENDQMKLITVRTSLSKRENVTTVSRENDPLASATNYSIHDLQQVLLSLDKTFNDQARNIESSPSVSYQKMMDTQRQLDQKLNTSNGKSEVESSAKVTYGELLDTQGKLDYIISRNNSGVKAASGLTYEKVRCTREALDSLILADESTVESSPGVSYKKLLANQLKLDQQLTVRR